MAGGLVAARRLLAGAPAFPPSDGLSAAAWLAGDSIARSVPVPPGAGFAADGATVADLARALGRAARLPAGLVLLVGANDLLRGRSPGAVARDHARLLEAVAGVRRVTVVGVLPMRAGLQRRIPAASRIDALDEHLRRVASLHGRRYADLSAGLRDERGDLAAWATTDGIHLTPEAAARLGPPVVDLLTAS